MAKIRYSWYNSLRNEGHFMTKLSQEQLNNLSKEELVAETLMLQDQYIDLSQKVDFLTEQIILMNQRQFGRKTEKNSVPDEQLNLSYFVTVFPHHLLLLAARTPSMHLPILLTVSHVALRIMVLISLQTLLPTG